MLSLQWEAIMMKERLVYKNILLYCIVDHVLLLQFVVQQVYTWLKRQIMPESRCLIITMVIKMR